ncbi:MAG: phosphotransferase family protein, partial [Actinobacteria bacterium]|nr:phosphotransferase family protein [Actinomycetota bacterium]
FMTTAEVLKRYATVSGRDLGRIDYYIAFGYWKLCCIMAGVYARYAAGAMGETAAHQTEGFANMVSSLARLTDEAAQKV